jgi:hypothetical protein
MAEELILPTGRDSTAVQARLREMGAGLSFSLVAGGELRASVRLPDDREAAQECRRIIEEWHRNLKAPSNEP